MVLMTALIIVLLIVHSAGPHRGDQEQSEPGLRQGPNAGLLLRGGAEAAL